MCLSDIYNIHISPEFSTHFARFSAAEKAATRPPKKTRRVRRGRVVVALAFVAAAAAGIVLQREKIQSIRLPALPKLPKLPSLKKLPVPTKAQTPEIVLAEKQYVVRSNDTLWGVRPGPLISVTVDTWFYLV